MSRIAPGCRVRLVGLVARKEFNGEEAAVLMWVATKGRWAVRLIRAESGMQVKPENVYLAPSGVDLLDDGVLTHLLAQVGESHASFSGRGPWGERATLHDVCKRFRQIVCTRAYFADVALRQKELDNALAEPVDVTVAHASFARKLPRPSEGAVRKVQSELQALVQRIGLSTYGEGAALPDADAAVAIERMVNVFTEGADADTDSDEETGSEDGAVATEPVDKHWRALCTLRDQLLLDADEAYREWQPTADELRAEYRETLIKMGELNPTDEPEDLMRKLVWRCRTNDKLKPLGLQLYRVLSLEDPAFQLACLVMTHGKEHAWLAEQGLAKIQGLAGPSCSARAGKLVAMAVAMSMDEHPTDLNVLTVSCYTLQWLMTDQRADRISPEGVAEVVNHAIYYVIDALLEFDDVGR